MGLAVKRLKLYEERWYGRRAGSSERDHDALERPGSWQKAAAKAGQAAMPVSGDVRQTRVGLERLDM